MATRKAARRARSSRSRERSPKTTRPRSIARREPERARTADVKMGRTLDAYPDRVDVRDWFYHPPLIPLPDQVVSCDLVPRVLDQGSEGACTGYALAAVVNFHLSHRRIPRSVSPRMLYDMARRYDEWPGEKYEGSSARGAMKGWVSHGVCSEASWPADRRGAKFLTPTVATEAQDTPGGAYYRVMHRQIRDMHAALAEVGILYVTLMVHEGWQRPGPTTVGVDYVESANSRRIALPVIRRTGRADGGHAVAIVGYTRDGFIIQNSWGTAWGTRGFALLPYEDFLLHSTDVWVAQLGVPVKMTGWAEEGGADTRAGLHRALQAIPLADIRPYVVDIGNNGQLSDSGSYWTTVADLERLFNEIIPARTEKWARRRVMLYLHGGLNDEQAVAQRIVAFRDVFLANEIYPVHIMWESGVWESLNGLIKDLFTDVDDRAGAVGDWIRDLRDGLIEAKDRSLELTAALPGGALWSEMKENARLASMHPDRKGGMQLIAQHAQKALAGVGEAERRKWELHVVGHSAGSIFAAHALRQLIGLRVTLKTVQFMAPAITVSEFKELVLPHVKAGDCPPPTMYVLSDSGELDDEVGPYGKSLLYLVSNAFEDHRGTPILGMEKFLVGADADAETARLYRPGGAGRVVVAGKGKDPVRRSASESHGGFDNDPDTLNSIIAQILDGAPTRRFQVRDLQFEDASGAAAGKRRGAAAAADGWGAYSRRGG
jgi:hypothetical protein